AEGRRAGGRGAGEAEARAEDEGGGRVGREAEAQGRGREEAGGQEARREEACREAARREAARREAARREEEAGEEVLSLHRLAGVGGLRVSGARAEEAGRTAPQDRSWRDVPVVVDRRCPRRVARAASRARGRRSPFDARGAVGGARAFWPQRLQPAA